MVAQNVLIWAAPLHNIEKSLGVPNGGSRAPIQCRVWRSVARTKWQPGTAIRADGSVALRGQLSL